MERREWVGGFVVVHDVRFSRRGTPNEMVDKEAPNECVP
jgi:hypothetical protein